MDVRELYDLIGGDYDTMIARLRKDSLAERFVLMFIDDKSFSELVSAMERKDVKAAFTAAHTLKGVSANLSFAKLGSSAVEITELLRSEDLAGAEAVLPRVKSDYEMTVAAIEKFKSERA